MSTDTDLTLEEQACNFQTMRHIEKVRNYLSMMAIELLERARLHDQSKLQSPEVEAFTKLTPILSKLTFGSPEYNASKKELGEALDHHYAKNRHHPQHYKNGIRDMNLIDMIEMFCDWKAASERHNDGNLRKSITINGDKEHFNFPPELIEIFENTVDLVE